MQDISFTGVVERRLYLIDHFRVSFEGGTSWHCACHEFVRVRSCRHTREAAGMRDAQALISRRLLVGASGLRAYTRKAF